MEILVCNPYKFNKVMICKIWIFFGLLEDFNISTMGREIQLTCRNVCLL